MKKWIFTSSVFCLVSFMIVLPLTLTIYAKDVPKQKSTSSNYPYIGKTKDQIKKIFSSWESRETYNSQYNNSIKFRKNVDLVIYFKNGKACGFAVSDLPGAYDVGISEATFNDLIKKFAGNSNVKKSVDRENGVIREAEVGTIIDE